MTLQEEHPISEDWIGQHADAADVYQNGGVSNIVYLSQMITLSGRVEAAALGNRPRGLYSPFDLLSICLASLTRWRPGVARKPVMPGALSRDHYTQFLLIWH